MKNRPVAEQLFYVDRQTEGRTERLNDDNCPFSEFFRKSLKYLMDFINWLKEILKIPPSQPSRLTAYCFGKQDFKFVCSVYIKPSHFQKPMFFSLSTKRESTNDIRVGHVLTFGMLDTSRIVTPFNALWSHSVAKTVIMLRTVQTVVTIFCSSYYLFICPFK
jgi:hypothetical protein